MGVPPTLPYKPIPCSWCIIALKLCYITYPKAVDPWPLNKE